MSDNKPRNDCVHGYLDGLHCPTCTSKTDNVNHPAHYKSGGMESIEIIEAFQLGFCLGNVIKYVLRSGKKGDALEDLKKARWYLDREIGRCS